MLFLNSVKCSRLSLVNHIFNSFNTTLVSDIVLKFPNHSLRIPLGRLEMILPHRSEVLCRSMDSVVNHQHGLIIFLLGDHLSSSAPRSEKIKNPSHLISCPSNGFSCLSTA
ncbi:hypothetical protein CEXT_24621 [Caerostris extrusa]|uniref:Uncharacterized protein n=1 Tax=Caerostris extrusa TaxID=172846 RepID=A0AAV4V8Q3_CAEEX|nr:hypothetical protein CEXT_24621 [Caerostris extrusa]